MKRLFLTSVLLTLLSAVGPAVAADKDTKAAAKTPTAAQKATAEKLDLNTASEQELSQLTGIGEIRSKAIIKGRPYKSKDELVDRKILTPSVYAKIKDQVIAKQAK